MSATQTQQMATQLQVKGNQRSQLEVLIKDFQNKLGKDWEKYHESLTLYLVGKLSRSELVSIVGPMLKNGLIKWHNKFLLLNFANSLQDSPVEFSSELASFWNKKNSKTKNVRSTQYEKFKRNIMGLPLKERRRIRSITRDSGKRNKINASITLTRQALLPKIPMIQDKEQQQLQVNNLVQWQQDVVNGINAPLAATCYELPDTDNLSRRVLMTMREHGLTGGVNTQVLEMISLGLEAHLKTILENAIDVSRYREQKYNSNDFLSPKDDTPENGSMINGHSRAESLSGIGSRKRNHDDSSPTKKETVVLNVEDMYNTLEMFPHLVEPNGAKIRLSNVMLQNDDQAADTKPHYDLKERPAEVDTAIISNGAVKDKKALTVDKAAHSENGSQKPPQTPSTQSQSQNGENTGSADELKWLVHDLISAM
ncbi:uncharacterized protein CXQ87_003403 [Candidozyma duobushaemuli]|uniref:Transcriptional coactivator HFI1/ADA1 n=2 Tax=Candidozyma TaxID=3303203 RepID=A0ABX8IDG1_9ASCO|nr:uncharacterized protein CXQ87_003403 [[Candida] duobushaemulonis]PVH15560.1 hypothetical protein CXQ87_003403 [[Candida] duobushaemulonis]QWU88766.1 hypothetical protein CA3LBN_003074 [[Candida] haemuloni]